MFLNQWLGKGYSVRKVQIMRTVLSAALTRALREELVPRNVARLVELPQWQRGTIRPWIADEAKQFLGAARPDPVYAALVLLILYGLRRGEVLGLRWTDIDFEAGTIQVRARKRKTQQYGLAAIFVLRDEADTLHRRQPYSVLMALFFMNEDACWDGVTGQSSFAHVVFTLRKRAGRAGPDARYDLFEQAFVDLSDEAGHVRVGLYWAWQRLTGGSIARCCP